ncbi:molybdopterin-containing oxidoreductase family protein [Pelotomaculum propionicicum]|uniref:molybdopterin-containing oxidoreductase family protein n=1 Tax=Pelotomaculum propionicicum TaxID=258475 RepID=UPI003B810920
MTEIKQTFCGICSAGCGMDITLEEGRVVKVEGQAENAYTQGYLCPKGKAVRELLEAPDRLKSPLKKTASGRWEEVTWDEAFSFIAGKLEEIKSRHGAQAVAVHVGQAGVGKEFTPYAQRFSQAYGTPNFSTAGSHCHHSKTMASEYTYGTLPVPDYENSSCIVLWAYNPTMSCPPLMRIINGSLKRGAKLIVVDPRATLLAKGADCHLQLRPGTDGALALGMLSIVIEEKLYDREFVERWTVGFDRLACLAAEYTPEAVEKITRVTADKIREAARLYARFQPACIYPGIGVELHTNGFQAARAISVLQAITGNLDKKGGAVFMPKAKLSSLAISGADVKIPAIGRYEFPLFYKHIRQAQANIYSNAIIEGRPYPLKGMIIAGSNPLLTWPNAGKLKRALGSLEFLAVFDHFMTETASLADIILPAATFLHSDELCDRASLFCEPKISLCRNADPDSGVMTNWQIWVELARKMGYGEYFPWGTEEDALDYRLKPLGIIYKDLAGMPEGYIYGERIERKYENGGFRTPSGKVEIYSEELEQYGYDPLPVYKEPAESPLSTPDIFSEYPFILTTGARSPGYMHSRYRNLSSLRKLSPEPRVEMNQAKAKELGIQDGETVIVESLRGAIELRVKLTDDILPEVIYIPHGWDTANANILSDNEILDPVTGFPADRSLLARVVKKGS